ncbi:MAG: SPOR domain-containing protein [Flavobacterium sp.]|nr:SPOR domain-containing protein [Flavobacterium sp.]
MKNYNKISFQKPLLLLTFLASINLAHAQTTTVTQDSKFEQLLNEKRKINSGLLLSNTYKIQIFSGTADESKKMLMAFKKDFKMYDGTIVFNTPNYKVIVGNFKTRIEAEYNYSIIKKKNPTALIIKPNR